MRKIILAFGFLSLLTGCGGSGNHNNNGNNDAGQPVTYNLRVLEGSSISMSLQGTYINDTITGSSIIHPSGSKNQNGLTIDITEHILSLNANITDSEKTQKSYFGYSQGGLYSVEEEQTICTLPNTVLPTPLPTEAQPGYQSNIIRLDCDNGETMEVQYKLKKSGANSVEYSITYKRFLEGAAPGYAITTFSDTYTIASDMNIISYKYQYAMGPISIDLSSTTISVN